MAITTTISDKVERSVTMNSAKRLLTVLGTTGIPYLLRDEFTSDVAAPITSPRLCEPGKGTYVITADTGENMSVNGGRLVVAGGTGAAGATVARWLDNAGARFARVTGLCFTHKLTLNDDSGVMEIGLYNGNPVAGNVIHGWFINNTSTFTYQNGVSIRSMTIKSAVDYRFSYILLATGCIYILSDNYYPKVYWDNNNYLTTTPLALGFYTTSREFSSDSVRVYNHPTIENEASLISLNQANPTSTTEYNVTTENNLYGSFIADIEITAPDPLSGSFEFKHRYKDENNYWCAKLDDAGTYHYFSVIGGVPSSDYRTIAEVIAAGATITLRVLCDETYHAGYSCLSGTWTARGADTITTIYEMDARHEVMVTYTDYSVSSLKVIPTNHQKLTTLANSKTGKSYMALGDSTTAQNTWVSALITALQTASSEEWRQLPAHIAVGGETVTTSKNRIDAELAYRPFAPSHIFINLGINDMGDTLTDETTFNTNYGYIIDACHAKYPYAQIICTFPWRQGKDEMANTVAARITALVASRSGFSINGDDERVWKKGADDGATMTTDGIHLSVAGQTEKSNQMVSVLGY